LAVEDIMPRSTRKQTTDRQGRQHRPDADLEGRRKAIDAIVERVARLPVLDDRSAEEILGYDENGLPT
jgi:hypothetical protein